MRRRSLAAVLLCLLLGTTGCAGRISHWIVQTRDHQGDVAYVHGNLSDASTAYQLALRVDPKDEHARTGLVRVQAQLAQRLFAASEFEEALVELGVAAKYAPRDDRIVALRSQIEQAVIKRDIVVSNYPAYRESGAALRRSLLATREASARIVARLQRFDYSYDSSELSRAIRDSYEVAAQMNRVTQRLVQYRQLVDYGVPETPEAGAIAPPASLLPLP